MATTTASFRAEQRDLLSDTGTSTLFTNTQLDRFRDASLRNVAKFRVAKEVTNYSGTYTDMLLATTTQTDFAMPSGWLRVTGIQYWTNTSSTQFIRNSDSWDDRVRTGYITIYDAPEHFDNRIKLIGWKEWTGIDDSTMPQEYVDVFLYDSLHRALTSLGNKRAASRRSAAASRSSDVTLGSIAFWKRQFRDDFDRALREARKAPRPIGT